VSELHCVQHIDAVREAVAGWRTAGERIAFVPTMGNLHAGHYALLDHARAQATRVVASIFVNPTQFGPAEDFAAYPRSLAADRAGLVAHGCDLLFAPSVAQMYPRGLSDLIAIRVPGLEDILCGAFRPGHFSGVATVVARLLGIVQPDVAVFGAKDYQQLMVVRRVVDDLALPVRIDAAPTVREADGLALSSRNQYLEPAQRTQAAMIYATLQRARSEVLDHGSVAGVEAQALAALAGAGLVPDYVSIRDANDLRKAGLDPAVSRIVLAAAWLGNTRLIDNLLI